MIQSFARCARNVCKKADRVCLSVRPSGRMIHLEKRWNDLDEIWYGHYAIGDHPKIFWVVAPCSLQPTVVRTSNPTYPKIVLFNSQQWVIPTMRTDELVRWKRH
jgi:hypothetical protein